MKKVFENQPKFVDMVEMPMVHQSNREFVESLDCEFHNAFLKALPNRDDCIIDSKVTVLQVGMYPCIPGWHLDFIKRDSENNIVIKDVENTRLLHYFCFWGPAPTLILDTKVNHNFKSWSDANAFIQAGCDAQVFPVREAKMGYLESLGWNSYHRGQAAKQSGARIFFRATFGSDVKPTNKIRRQVQTYVPLNYGW